MTDEQRWARSGARPRLRFATDDRLIGLVRRGDPTAFEILYDRHSRELLSFCRYMLGSRHDAEDAVQATFASAYRALIADERAIVLRPWLFAIARNACLSVLRQRRPRGEGDRDVAYNDDPLAQVEQREDLRTMLATILELPERQRTALVLAELHGLSHEEIGTLLGVRASQVKSYVYQARSTLISERQARGADCVEIRKELSAARGAALLRGRLRRHLRSCADCSAYSERLSQQRRQFGALAPLAPALALKRRALEAVFGKGSSATAGTSLTGPTAELAGGGLKMLAVKALAAAACVGASAGVGVGAHLLDRGTSSSHRGTARLELAASKRPAGSALAVVSIAPARARPPASDGVHAGVGASGSGSSAGEGQGPSGGGDRTIAVDTPTAGQHTGQELHGGGEESAIAKSGGEAHGKAEEVHGKSETGKAEEPHGKSEEQHGKSDEAHGRSEEVTASGEGEASHGKSEEPHGQSEAVHGKGEAAAGSGEGEEPHGKSEEPHGKAK
jgi:RNA polymerase sigma factor (sigma-70 family)